MLKCVSCVGLTGFVSVAFEDEYVKVNEYIPVTSATKNVAQEL